MKYTKLFEEFISEGVYDPGILKAFFMAGGPGSGKSFVADEIFGFPSGAISSVSYATGLKLINNDNAFEKGLKAAGYSSADLAELAKDPEEWIKVMGIRDDAKRITRKFQDQFMSNKLGQVIDGTGKDFAKIKSQRRLYRDLGYDTYMVFVNTSLEIALERNKTRERQLDDKMVEKMWKSVQDNLGKFQRLFSPDRILIVDNSEYGVDILSQVEKQVAKHVNSPIKNRLGKLWIDTQLTLKKR